MDKSRREAMGLVGGLVVAGCAMEATAASVPTLSDKKMVARIWHGRTAADKADEYRDYLFEAGVKKIAAIPGNRGVQMMASKSAEQGEFMVVSYWDSIEAIKGYAGAEYTKVHDLPRDKEFLIDREALVRHFDLDVNLWQG